jgi:uncharacterized protein (DUF2235 family)
MGKTIVVCCDGTWVTPLGDTNIWRTHALLCQAIGMPLPGQPKGGIGVVERGRTGEGQGRDLVLYYDIGVGAERRNGILGGALARGLGRNVQEAYAFVAQTWEPGDEIYCFGFSRGAFTVRSLAGMIGASGLVDTTIPGAVDAAFENYRTPAAKRKPGALDGFGRRNVSVRFLGVYDTVGSLGIVAPALSFINRRFLADRIMFHDVRLGRRVEVACQALAIDERRGAFKPVVWSGAPGEAERWDGAVVPQTVHQVWFTGAHGDVGGGLAYDDLSCVPFQWMMRQAIEAGLPLEPELLKSCRPGNPRGPRHDSEKGLVGRLTSGALGSDLKPLVSSLPTIIALPARIFGAIGSLFRVPPNDRRIGGEQLHDDGTFSMAVGEAIHSSVLARYSRALMPDDIKRAIEAKVETWPEADEECYARSTGASGNDQGREDS